MLTSDFEWNLARPERFNDFFGASVYDVQAAKKILVDTPRPVQSWPRDGKYAEFWDDALESADMKHGTCEEGIKPGDDLPVIVVQEKKVVMMIDGLHRLQRQSRAGASTVAVALLTEEESARVRIR